MPIGIFFLLPSLPSFWFVLFCGGGGGDLWWGIWRGVCVVFFFLSVFISSKLDARWVGG